MMTYAARATLMPDKIADAAIRAILLRRAAVTLATAMRRRRDAAAMLRCRHAPWRYCFVMAGYVRQQLRLPPVIDAYYAATIPADMLPKAAAA